MKLLQEHIPLLSTVDFHGLELQIPVGYKWIAADSSGSIYIYSNEPEINIDYDSYTNGVNCELVAIIEFEEGDVMWSDSLLEIEDVRK